MLRDPQSTSPNSFASLPVARLVAHSSRVQDAGILVVLRASESHRYFQMGTVQRRRTGRRDRPTSSPARTSFARSSSRARCDLHPTQNAGTRGRSGDSRSRKFVGALHRQRARTGVFITTSTFAQDAIDYASRVEIRVVLIDGQRLASLMIDFGVGVSVEATHVIKEVDNDFFEE